MTDATPTGQPRESGDHDLPWSWPRMSDAELSTRIRLTYIKGGEREALETACYWQERAIGAEKREATTQRELAEARGKYHDLIYQVQMKYPDESRHDTAKRLIIMAQEGERRTGRCATALTPSPKDGEA